MATSNFYNRNASKVFAVLMNYEQPVLDENDQETDEMETVVPDEWEYDDFIDNLQDALIEKEYCDRNHSDNERNYSGRVIAERYTDQSFHGMTVEVNIKAIIRSAYYEGANLDWEIDYIYDGYTFDELPDEAELKEHLEYYGANAGMATIQSRNAHIWMQRQAEALIAELEKVFEEHSQPLNVVARFSNGETMYAKS